MEFVIGIDEVGRGPLAGPVVVCALAIVKDLKIKDKNLGKPRDSKMLSSAQRESWVKLIKNNPRIYYAISCSSHKAIDRINISAAANLAAWRAYQKLTNRLQLKTKTPDIFLDGGLYLKKKGFYSKAKTVIKGDQKIQAVSLASILAKVYRDRLMNRVAKKYPGYGFEVHKGYGTKMHYSALQKLGVSKVHRLTFLKKQHKITKS